MMAQSDRTEAFRVVGVSARVRNDDPASIERLWKKHRSTGVADQVPTRLSDDVFCVYHEYEGDQSAPFQMTIGHKVPDDVSIPDGMSEARVPAQPVKSYDASGEQPATLVATWQRIWDSDIPRAFAADFEVHDGTNPDKVVVHVGVKA